MQDYCPRGSQGKALTSKGLLPSDMKYRQVFDLTGTRNHPAWVAAPPPPQPPSTLIGPLLVQPGCSPSSQVRREAGLGWLLPRRGSRPLPRACEPQEARPGGDPGVARLGHKCESLDSLVLCQVGWLQGDPPYLWSCWTNFPQTPRLSAAQDCSLACLLPLACGFSGEPRGLYQHSFKHPPQFPRPHTGKCWAVHPHGRSCPRPTGV